jgi:hypothetical protein
MRWRWRRHKSIVAAIEDGDPTTIRRTLDEVRTYSPRPMSEIMSEVLEDARRLHAAGHMTEHKLAEFEALCVAKTGEQNDSAEHD